MSWEGSARLLEVLDAALPCPHSSLLRVFRAVGASELGAARFLKDPLCSLVSGGAGFHLPTLQCGHTELASGTGAAAGASPGAGGAWPWVSPGQHCMARQAALLVVVTVPSWELSAPCHCRPCTGPGRTPPLTCEIQVNLCILFTCLKRKE